jgi:WS/DGAT/MGAT family acyltransferase
MAKFYYDRLTFLDNSFLLAESSKTPMHIAGTASYDIGPLRTPEGGVDVERIRGYVESRLHLIPRYRQVLNYTPIEGHPVWIDDRDFNIDYHVRHTALPKPGDERQLKRLSGRIMSQQLDRSRPLWEMWIVEGLDGGDRFAVITKVHHCMVDGMSSVDLLEVLLTPEPTSRVEPPSRWVPRPAPGSMDLLWAEAQRWLRVPFDLVRGVGSLVDAARNPRSDIRSMLRATRDMLGSSLRQVSDTPLNKPIGPHRRFDWLEMDLADVKKIRRALGGSLNDVVLTIVTGAVQRFLENRRVNVDFLDFRVMAPVSVRSADQRGKLGNQVSAWMVDLPLAERDPKVRLALISETTGKLKESKQALGADILTRVAEWTPSTLLSLGAQMLTRALPFNLVVTNVPGPQIPLYLLGARMRDNFGQVPLTDYLGLGIVLFSYSGKLCWGLNADWDLLPDLHGFVTAIESAFAELQEAAEKAEMADAARSPETMRSAPRAVKIATV